MHTYEPAPVIGGHEPDPAGPRFVAGLDLGQASDRTALVILKRRPTGETDHRGHPVHRYACKYLKRFDLGVPYPEIVANVAATMAEREVRWTAEEGRLPEPILAIDATGVGRAVVDQVLNAHVAAETVPVTIGGAGEPRQDTWNETTVPAWWIPKMELVASVRVHLDTRTLEVGQVREAKVLEAELRAFQVKITAAAHETAGAWRERDHDDCVLALALAVYLGDRPVPAPAEWGPDPFANVAW